MASICFTERGDCLFNLGRYDEAAIAYEESIRRAEKHGAERSAATGKFQLGSVRIQQHRYKEALAAYEEARERFTRLDEPGSVAVTWHQTGMVYQEAGQAEAAEDAYRTSLAIKVRLGDLAGQATTLGQMGTLYANVGRPEEAVAFYREAVDRSVQSRDSAKEGIRRNNLAATLRKLHRLDEARQEIHRALECKEQFGHATEPWTSWDILSSIESDAGQLIAAAEAKRRAIECYLAYRRDGGENHYTDGRVSLAVREALLTSGPAAAASFLQVTAADSDLPNQARTFIEALQAIVAGSRDRTLADAPDLSFTMAAEILFLIETLEARE
jgi:tetratricopeptide (TPR) repeat protein